MRRWRMAQSERAYDAKPPTLPEAGLVGDGGSLRANVMGFADLGVM